MNMWKEEGEEKHENDNKMWIAGHVQPCIQGRVHQASCCQFFINLCKRQNNPSVHTCSAVVIVVGQLTTNIIQDAQPKM